MRSARWGDGPSACHRRQREANGAASGTESGTEARGGGPCCRSRQPMKNEDTMQKLTAADPETKSIELAAANLAALRALFPELVTEGPDGVAVNLDVLKQLVGDQTVID